MNTFALLTLVIAAQAAVPQAAAPQAAAPAAAKRAVVRNGSYVLDGGFGELRVHGKRFNIDVVGANAHTCALEGTVSGDEGATAADDNAVCHVRFTEGPEGLDVIALDQDACHNWCGARAWFEGRYLTKLPQCTSDAVDKARAASKKHLAAGDAKAARADVAGVLDRCERRLSLFTIDDLRNDAAVAAHAGGDDAACKKHLAPLVDLAQTNDADISGTEPAYHDVLVAIAKTTRANLALCGAPVTVPAPVAPAAAH